MDDGLREADASGTQDKICAIYDRRGLEYDNIDPNMYQFCKRVINEMSVSTAELVHWVMS